MHGDRLGSDLVMTHLSGPHCGHPGDTPRHAPRRRERQKMSASQTKMTRRIATESTIHPVQPVPAGRQSFAAAARRWPAWQKSKSRARTVYTRCDHTRCLDVLHSDASLLCDSHNFKPFPTRPSLRHHHHGGRRSPSVTSNHNPAAPGWGTRPSESRYGSTDVVAGRLQCVKVNSQSSESL